MQLLDGQSIQNSFVLHDILYCIGPQGQSKVFLLFKWKCIGIQMRVHQGSFDITSIEPWCTLIWTRVHFHLPPEKVWIYPGALFSKMKEKKNKICFFFYGKQLIINFGIPLIVKNNTRFKLWEMFVHKIDSASIRLFRIEFIGAVNLIKTWYSSRSR